MSVSLLILTAWLLMGLAVIVYVAHPGRNDWSADRRLVMVRAWLIIIVFWPVVILLIRSRFWRA